MATWAVVKAQARDILGNDLTDANVFDVPLLATDDYGNFIKGPNGFPQVVFPGNVLHEGDPTANAGNGISLAGHQFLIDIAHSADPSAAPGLLVDDNDVIGGPQPDGTYDDELLDAHYMAGDGRVNENIGLTAVHAIFHSEHNRLVEQTKDVVRAALAAGDVNFAAEWVMGETPKARVAALAGGIADNEWNGERLFQAATTAVRQHERRAGRSVACDLASLPTEVSFSVKTCLYRFVREALDQGSGPQAVRAECGGVCCKSKCDVRRLRCPLTHYVPRPRRSHRWRTPDQDPSQRRVLYGAIQNR